MPHKILEVRSLDLTSKIVPEPDIEMTQTWYFGKRCVNNQGGTLHTQRRHTSFFLWKKNGVDLLWKFRGGARTVPQGKGYKRLKNCHCWGSPIDQLLRLYDVANSHLERDCGNQIYPYSKNPIVLYCGKFSPASARLWLKTLETCINKGAPFDSENAPLWAIEVSFFFLGPQRNCEKVHWVLDKCCQRLAV